MTAIFRGFWARWTAVLAAGLLAGAGGALAQAYPDTSIPMKLVVPFGPGSGSDVIARALGRAITEVSGMNVIVENKPGADTVIGVRSVLSAPADGYTMLLVSSSTTVLNPLMVPNNPIDMVRDFVPLVAIAKNSPAFNVGPSTTFKTIGEFVRAAKASPGKLTYGSATTTTQLASQLLEARAGIDLLYVPYKTTAGALTALAAGEVDLVMVDPGSANGVYGTGRVRPLAIGAPARIPAFPQLPTMIEEGIADYQITSWFGTYMVNKTPADRVNTFRAIVAKAVATRTYLDALTRVGLDPFAIQGEEITELTRTDIERWARFIRTSKPAQPK